MLGKKLDISKPIALKPVRGKILLTTRINEKIILGMQAIDLPFKRKDVSLAHLDAAHGPSGLDASLRQAIECILERTLGVVPYDDAPQGSPFKRIGKTGDQL